MKYLAIFLTVVLLSLLTAVLYTVYGNEKTIPVVNNQRIKTLEQYNNGSAIFYILEVDGEQYLSQKSGGIIKLK